MELITKSEARKIARMEKCVGFIESAQEELQYAYENQSVNTSIRQSLKPIF